MRNDRQGYYQHPTVQGSVLAFVCEEDLWSAPLSGGIPRRLTSNLGRVSFPRFSPDGQWLAFCGREEGQPDVYVMPAHGGDMQRLTYLGAVVKIIGWTKDSSRVLFLSNHQPRAPMEHPHVFTVSLEGEYPTVFLDYPTLNLALDPRGSGIAIGRNNDDNARWKRYRGGRAGEIWIDRQGDGNFVKLPLPEGNPNGPLWIDDRIYFASDHDGIGNLYSCSTDGDHLRPETHHREFYVRHAATDGQTIVYRAGADLFSYNVRERRGDKITIAWHSPRVQTQRKFISAARYLENYHLHPAGHVIAVTARGKLFAMAHWEDAPRQYGPRDEARHRIVRWLSSGDQLVAVSDQDGIEEKLAVFSGDPSLQPERLISLMPGRVQIMLPSPTSSEVAIATSRLDLWLVDSNSGNRRLIDFNNYGEFRGLTFSADGRWLAYRKHISETLRALFVCELATGVVRQITLPVIDDFSPSFDPDGRFLYFISRRVFNPVDDSVQFDVSFPATMKPYLVTLRKDTPNPFIPLPSAPGEESNNNVDQNKASPAKKSENGAPREVRIDFDGILHRLVEFPVKEGIYKQVMGLKDKVVFTSFPINGRADLGDHSATEEDEIGTLWVYDFITHKIESIATDVANIQVANQGKTLAYRNGKRLRVLKAGEKPADNGSTGANRKSGWLDLGRIKFSVDPVAEWRQMFREAWRLQKEFFWTEDMSGVDWQRVYDRYEPLLDRIATRHEFSDLVWEMQGELGTSHAYEIGGDYRYPPFYTIGRLGADLEFDPATECYRFRRIYRGDVWMKDCSSPLAAPGINVSEGEALVAIGGVRLTRTITPGQLLASQAGQDILITVQGLAPASEPRQYTVRALRTEYAARYREWVERNVQRVATATDGKIGYLHIPNMGTAGLIEFHRYFLSQTDKDGLIIDVRFNGGGNVSSILLEKLRRRPIGYDVRRWGSPFPYPLHSVRGPIVALTNEFAGSDGDIFCHCFRMLNLGLLIGKRTWGGVIGIDSRYTLADGGYTTQPQYSFWAKDSKWGVENYGVDPDIEADNDPTAYLQGDDPQLQRAIDETLRLLAEQTTELPQFDERPVLSLPG